MPGSQHIWSCVPASFHQSEAKATRALKKTARNAGAQNAFPAKSDSKSSNSGSASCEGKMPCRWSFSRPLKKQPRAMSKSLPPGVMHGLGCSSHKTIQFSKEACLRGSYPFCAKGLVQSMFTKVPRISGPPAVFLHFGFHGVLRY
jgi:hypothetical protein